MKFAFGATEITVNIADRAALLAEGAARLAAHRGLALATINLDRRVNVRPFNSYVLALQAARRGQGVALRWSVLVEPLIDAGTLVRVTNAEIVAPQSNFVTWSARRPLSSQATLLKDWLVSLGSLSSAQASRLPISLEQPALRRSAKAKVRSTRRP